MVTTGKQGGCVQMFRFFYSLFAVYSTCAKVCFINNNKNKKWSFNTILHPSGRISNITLLLCYTQRPDIHTSIMINVWRDVSEGGRVRVAGHSDCAVNMALCSWMYYSFRLTDILHQLFFSKKTSSFRNNYTAKWFLLIGGKWRRGRDIPVQMAAKWETDNCWLLVFNWPDGDFLKIVSPFCTRHYARCRHVFCCWGSPNQNNVRTAHRDIILRVASLPHSGLPLLMWPTNGQRFINTRWKHRTAGMLGQERTNERTLLPWAGVVWDNKHCGPSCTLCLCIPDSYM